MDSQTKLYQIGKDTRPTYEKALILKILQDTSKNSIPVIFRNDIVERFVHMGLPKPYDSSLRWAEENSGIIKEKIKVKGMIKYYLQNKENTNARSNSCT